MTHIRAWIFTAAIAGVVLTVHAATVRAEVPDAQTIVLTDNSGGQYFTVLEVEGLQSGTTQNWLLGAATTASSFGYGGDPPNATDGDLSAGCCGQLWHGNNVNAQLTIRLPVPKTLDQINFSGRQGCCPDRADDFQLQIFNSSGMEVFNQQVLGAGTASAGGTPFNVPLGAAGAADPYPPMRLTLQNATATFDQGAPYTIASSIDGNLDYSNGWAIFGQQNQNQTAVFQTDAPVSATELTFDLMHRSQYGSHKIQDFRLSYTTDPNPTAGDGSINWTELTPTIVGTSDPGTDALIDTLSNTVEVSGASSAVPDNYQVIADGDFEDITGFRLEVFPGANGSIGFDGSNGNIVLTEFMVSASNAPAVVPEPATIAIWSLFALGLAGLGCRRFRRRSK